MNPTINKVKYHRLSLDEREEISRGLANKETYENIANRIERNIGTISREVNRKGMNEKNYRAHRAHSQAKRKKRLQGRKSKIKKNIDLEKYILEKLCLRWSPDQIAKEMKKDYPDNKDMQVSSPTIYTYIYVLSRGSLKKEMITYLRQHKQKRRKMNKGAKSVDLRGQIPEMISIEERPKEVEDRIIGGHWEGDLILGKYKQSALGTLVERTTRTVILVPLKAKDAESVRKAFAHELKTIPSQMKLSLTYDQGKEMTHHKLFTKETKIKVYFAHPGSPWERGTNENTNGLIRQFFPKGTDFHRVSRKEIKHVQDLLNGRPRKVLNWRKPYEVFNELINQFVAIEV